MDQVKNVKSYQLIGIKTGTVYFESNNKAELNRWRLNHYSKKRVKKGGSKSSMYEVNEPMVFSSSRDRRISLETAAERLEMENSVKAEKANESSDQVYMFGVSQINSKIIKRRKQVERLYRDGTNLEGIIEKTGASKSTVRQDIYILRQIFPELKEPAKI